mmetsp:Transcript_1959/g.7780  ORF Transcript_1959/g.7780 Transcript_1959/m.7780 type:complete len:225 (-) Transcript_1959:833-1507(-)
MVPGRHTRVRARRLRPREGHDGDPPVRVRVMGGHSELDGQTFQGDGRGERVLPAAHPVLVHHQRSEPRRGLRPRARRRHAGRRQRARGAARRAPHVGDDREPHVLAVDPELPRFASVDEPVGERAPLGDAHAPVHPHARVSVAGGAHRARHRRGGGGEGDRDGQRVRRVRGDDRGDAGGRRTQVRGGVLRGRGPHVHHRGDDGRPPRASGGHLAQPRPELRQGV